MSAFSRPDGHLTCLHSSTDEVRILLVVVPKEKATSIRQLKLLNTTDF